MREKIQGSPSQKQWERIGLRHHHGVNVPLFSIWTQKSCGIGEYLDLLPLIDLCHEVGFDVIQLLPLNDSGADSSPYNARSAFALHPIYLSLHALPNLENHPPLQGRIAQLHHLSRYPYVDWPRVQEEKTRLLHDYLELEGEALARLPELEDFQERRPWLAPYTRRFDPKYGILTQFLCHQQLKRVKEHAEEKGLWIKGDIPILISRESADVLEHPEIFLQDYSAGAPPDMYNADGQDWGFPLFNWDKLRETELRWWRQRVQAASSYYHIYRIDHVVGFFRIWAIAQGKKAHEGFFLPENEEEWLPQGREILQTLLESSNMLPIAEDLGSVPPSVRDCLRSLGICGTKVLRWERDWHGDHHFLEPSDYEALSLSTVSTHDSETLREWWMKYPEEAKAFAQKKSWKYEGQASHDQIKEILLDSHRSGSLFHINLLQEYLACIPGQHWSKAEQDRINVPGTTLPSNWTFRHKLPLEEMASNSEILSFLSGLASLRILR